MKKIISFAIFFFILITTFAQRTITIKIYNGLALKPISGITVKLQDIKLKTTREATTDSAGLVSFTSLENNNFLLSIDESTSYFSHQEEISIPNNGQVFSVYLTPLRLSLLDEVIINSRRQPIVNRKDATVQSFITKTEIEKLPIEGRDITKSFIRLPNITSATLGYNEAPQITINGGNPIYTNYLIDGMDNNERFLGNVKFNTPFGFTESVNILTNNYSAEYGNTSNGIVNVTTRSGSNKFSGEVFYVTRPGKIIDSKSPFAALDLYGNPVKDGFQRQQLGVGLGGAIKKDKTFYYINFEQTNDIKDNLLNSPQLGVNETVRGNNYFSYASGKIDQYWSKNLHSSLRINYGKFDIDVQAGGLTGGILFPSAGSTQKNRTYIIAFKNDYKLSNKLSGGNQYPQILF